MGLWDRLFGKSVKRVDLDKRYDRVGTIGAGTMSQVWRARDRKTGKSVAVKVLDGEQTRKFEARFPGMNKPTEGEIAVMLDHPRIVKTLEHGITTENLQYLIMEFIAGMPIGVHIEAQDELLKANRVRFMIELGQALAYLHGKGYIHRDFNPKNILVTDDKHIKVIDFGLAVPNTPPFRAPGNRTGTLNYMAPELILRKPTDEKIDIFSYAVTCFEMCTRRLPWEPAKSYEALLSHLNAPPKELRELAPDLEPEVAEVIIRGMKTNPKERWQSASQMVDALRAAVE